MKNEDRIRLHSENNLETYKIIDREWINTIFISLGIIIGMMIWIFIMLIYIIISLE